MLAPTTAKELEAAVGRHAGNRKVGKVVWQHEYEDKFYASPTIAGTVMILQGRKGNAYLIEPGDAFKEIGKADIGEECGASPVPVGNRLYLRGKSHLFCIEGQAP